MKRAYRTVAAVFAAVLMLSTVLMRFAWNASAVDSVILMVTGYKINDPRDASMPFFRNGQLYAPVEMFVTLGLTANEQETTVILSNMKSGRILLFDTVRGTATDAEGVYTATAVRKNGLWFVPAEFTSARLDLTYAYHDVAPAPFVRITYPDDNLMSSESFLRYYRSSAPEILERFAPVTTPPTTAAPVTTTATTTTPPQTTTLPSSAVTAPPTTPRQPARYNVFWVVESLADADAMLA
ncbi:MAG: hypothetical protein IKU55_02055, partial [Clostridia bacterium]|nr:hypothetical protein [Clostridia bacterium]